MTSSVNAIRTGTNFTSGAFNGSLGTIDGSSSGNSLCQVASVSFSASRVARTSNTTHGKQKGVKYIIKVL